MKTFAAALAKCQSQIQDHEQKSSIPDKKLLWSKLDKTYLRGIEGCLSDLVLFWRELLEFYESGLDEGARNTLEDTKQLLLLRLNKQELPPNVFRQLQAEEVSLIGYTRNAALTAYVNSKWATLDTLAHFVGSAVGDKDDGEVSFGSVFQNQKLTSFWRTRLIRECKESNLGGLAFSYFLRNQICHCGFTVRGKPIFNKVSPDFTDLLSDQWSDEFLDVFKMDHSSNSDFRFLANVPKDVREQFISSSGPKVIETIKLSHESAIKFATKTVYTVSALVDLTDS